MGRVTPCAPPPSPRLLKQRHVLHPAVIQLLLRLGQLLAQLPCSGFTQVWGWVETRLLREGCCLTLMIDPEGLIPDVIYPLLIALCPSFLPHRSHLHEHCHERFLQWEVERGGCPQYA